MDLHLVLCRCKAAANNFLFRFTRIDLSHANQQRRPLKTSNRVLTAIFLLSGVLHLVNPDAFGWLMPPWLPEPTLLIYVSGVLELVCAIGFIFKQRWAGWLSALVLLAVWPANIWYAFNVLGSANVWLIVAAWVRLPLQLPLMYFAVKYSRSEKPSI
jgi:uncharacterized membrane protein